MGRWLQPRTINRGQCAHCPVLVGDAAAAVEVVFVGSLEEVGVTALEVVGAASDELEVNAQSESTVSMISNPQSTVSWPSGGDPTGHVSNSHGSVRFVGGALLEPDPDSF